MVTLTLIQGVVNTFVIFFARVIGFFVDRVLLKNDRGLGPGRVLKRQLVEEQGFKRADADDVSCRFCD